MGSCLEWRFVMSKYSKLWEYIKNQNTDSLKLSYDEIEQIASCPIDHSFLTYKKEFWSLDGLLRKSG